jgi:hypothetical protein
MNEGEADSIMHRAISILTHGGAKSGKSTFAATSPAPRLLIDAEAGSRFLDIRPVTWNPNTDPPPTEDDGWDTAKVVVRSYDDVIKTYEWLRSGQHPFKSVIIDSFSEIQQRLIEKLTNRGQAREQDWGEIFRNFAGLMRDFRDLTEHASKPLTAVILVGMSQLWSDGKMHPYAQGQTKTLLPYLFDVIGAMKAYSWNDETGQHVLHRLLIGPNDEYETGERVGRGRLPEALDDPSVVDILDRVFGPEVDETQATAKSHV